jgi:hypothetical protein
MSEPLNREYADWLDADRRGHDDDADALCRETFAALPARSVPLTFAANTMAGVKAARAADAARTKRARAALLWGSVLAGPVAIYFAAGAVMSGAAALLLGILNLLVNTTVQIASVGDWNVWSLVGSLGRALAAIMSDADVTLIVVAMHGLAFAALAALQRLLGPDTESYK